VSPHREPGAKTVRVDVELLRRVHRILHCIGSVNAGMWPEVDALKVDVAKAVIQEGDYV
jgi:hypothetical protein